MSAETRPAHTPLPWLVGPFGDIWPASDVEFVDGKWREKCPEPRIIVSLSKGNLLPNEDAENAALIVRAVNSYEATERLVEECETGLRVLRTYVDTAPFLLESAIMERIDAALASIADWRKAK